MSRKEFELFDLYVNGRYVACMSLKHVKNKLLALTILVL